MNINNINDIQKCNISLFNIIDIHGNTPLHIYVINFKLDIIKELFKNTKTKNKMHELCNVQNKYGNTPLHLSKNPEISKFLIHQGANPFIPNQKGEIVYNTNTYNNKDIIDNMYFIKTPNTFL
jgi:ankyrin repeat protein